MVDPVFDLPVRHIPVEIDGVPVFLVKMPSALHCRISLAQVFDIIGTAFQRNTRFLGIQRQEQEHLPFYFEHQRNIIERETFRHVLQRQAIFPGFFYIHTVSLFWLISGKEHRMHLLYGLFQTLRLSLLQL